MKGLFVEIFSVVLAFVFIFNYAPTVRAQGASEYEFTLEEITVTAQKREENVQDVPNTVDIVMGEKLIESGNVDLYDALREIPSVIVAAEDITIRGMGLPVKNDSGDSMVAVTVDFTSSEPTAENLYDIQRIEVLTGPQVTIYGRNAGGGAINIHTNEPKDIFETSGSIEFGNYDLLNLQGVINVPLNDMVAMRLAMQVYSRAGYMDNDSMYADRKSGRLKFSYQPNDKLKTILTLESTPTGTGASQPYANLFDRQDGSEDVWKSDKFNDSNYGKENKLYMTTTYDLGYLGVLTFIPSIVDSDEHQFNLEESRTEEGVYEPTEKQYIDDQKYIELRITSPSGQKVEYVGGISWEKNHDYFENLTKKIGSGHANWRDQFETSIGAYGNLTYALTDRFKLDLGIRYSKAELDSTELQEERSTTPEHTVFKEDNTDYSIGFMYDVTEETMVWGDYSTVFRMPTKSTQSPETLDTYQFGIKTRFLEDRIQLNSTSWYYDYENYQHSERKLYIDEDGFEYFYWGDGSGPVTMYGLDSSLDAIITEKDRISISHAWLHTRMEEVTLTFEETFMEDWPLEGGELQKSPHHTLDISYEHLFSLPNKGTIQASIGTNIRSSYKCAFELPGDDEVPEGMTREGIISNPRIRQSRASITYFSPSDRWILNAYVKNIENAAVKRNIEASLELGPPRTYGISLQMKF